MLVDLTALPADPLAAAAQFYREAVPTLPAEDAALTLAFAFGTYRDTGWRRAAVQELARMIAPRRVNAVAGGIASTVAAAAAYLAAAPGVTGQYLPLDDNGAGTVLSSGQ